MPQTAAESLDLARRHLVKVQAAWDDPTDWADLSLYGFLCLEACIVARYLASSTTAPLQSPGQVSRGPSPHRRARLARCGRSAHRLEREAQARGLRRHRTARGPGSRGCVS